MGLHGEEKKVRFFDLGLSVFKVSEYFNGIVHRELPINMFKIVIIDFPVGRTNKGEKGDRGIRVSLFTLLLSGTTIFFLHREYQVNQ